MRRLTVLALAAVTALLGGCAAATNQPYEPTDGVRAVLGEGIHAENLTIISADKGDPGLLLGGLVNDSDKPVTVTIAVADAEPLMVSVPARGTVLLDPQNPHGTRLTVDAVPAPPGATVSTELSTPVTGAISADIPILDGTFAQYASLVPTP